jgi:hypothetical protein
MLIARIGRQLFGVDFIMLEADGTGSGHRSFPFEPRACIYHEEVSIQHHRNWNSMFAHSGMIHYPRRCEVFESGSLSHR